MKALTLHEPWASLIASGAKAYETRDWAPPGWLVGQTIAIHAGKADPMKLSTADLGGSTAVEAMLRGLKLQRMDALPLGCIVCTAKLAGIYWSQGATMTPHGTMQIDTGDGTIELRPGEEYFGSYGAGRCLWHLVEIRRVAPPKPARGMQKLWDWKEHQHA